MFILTLLVLFVAFAPVFWAIWFVTRDDRPDWTAEDILRREG